MTAFAMDNTSNVQHVTDVQACILPLLVAL